MIIDNLEFLYRYKSVIPSFDKVLNFIEKNDIHTLELGKHEIDGNRVFVSCQQVSPKSKDEAKLETHNKYIDIQIPLSACETMGYSSRSSLQEGIYDELKDITFYKEKAASYINIDKGMFAVFFPQDAHAPGINSDGIKKLVFKILI